MPNDVKFEGFDECRKKLLAMQKTFPKTAFRKALRASGKVVRVAMLKLVPVRTGDTKRAIKVRAGKRKKGFLSMLVGMTEGLFKGNYFYAGFTNYGWKTGKRGSTNRRAIPGKHWAEQAFEQSKQQALDEMTRVLAEELDKLAKGSATNDAV